MDYAPVAAARMPGVSSRAAAALFRLMCTFWKTAAWLTGRGKALLDHETIDVNVGALGSGRAPAKDTNGQGVPAG